MPLTAKGSANSRILPKSGPLVMSMRLVPWWCLCCLGCLAGEANMGMRLVS